MRRISFLAAAMIACSSLNAPARAETIWGLTTGNQLFSFDSASPSSISAPVTISQTGIIDIDFNNVNGALYGATANGNLYFINPFTGAASLAAAAGSGLDGSVTDFDFNPAADRVRVFTNGATNENFRMVPDASAVSAPQVPGTPGAVTVDGNFSNAAAVLVGSAYTNAFNNPASTTLYSIDTTSDSLMIHSGAPQFNTITQVGIGLGFSLGSDVGFDIGASGIAFLSSGSSLYSVDLGTGAATSLGGIGSLVPVSSIAVQTVPEPGTMCGLALAGLGAIWHARRRWKTAG